jgi:glycine oxidase
MNTHSDVLIIGGGVIGLTTAYFLAQTGATVCLVDCQTVGRESSWAGAGILPPGNLKTATTPMSRLRAISCDLWGQLSRDLKICTGIDNGYSECGSIKVFREDDAGIFGQTVRRYREQGIVVDELDRSGLNNHFPNIHHGFTLGAFLPEYAAVSNRLHLQALMAVCRKLKIAIHENVRDLILSEQKGRVKAKSAFANLSASQICVTAGSWSREILQSVGFAIPVEPVRGQIVQLKPRDRILSSIIEYEQRYLVPRADGRIIVGSTEEWVGFDNRTTVEGIAKLLDFANSLSPELRHAEIESSWAGLRPGSLDGLPFVGLVPGFENLFVGTGHFRSGLQLSTGTGIILRDLILDRDPNIEMDGLRVERVVIPRVQER